MRKNPIPPYKKWFDSKSEPAVRRLSEGKPHQQGEKIDEHSDGKSQGPPSSSSDSFTFSHSFEVPFKENEAAEQEPIQALCSISLTVDDWGTASVDGKKVVDLTSGVEDGGKHGGHQLWTGSGSCTVSSGSHTLSVQHTNIDMPDPNWNQAVCNYSISVVELEPGGEKCEEECGCGENEPGDPPGGVSPESSSFSSRSNAVTLSPFDSSGAGSGVVATATGWDMLWSCRMGTFRGIGDLPPGKLQIHAKEFSSALAGPAALQFSHPLTSRLNVPEGGIVPGARFELVQGARVIAMRCYTDGSVHPVGVDTSGGGRATLMSIDGTSYLRWMPVDGSTYLFTAAAGELYSYTSPNKAILSNVSDYFSIKRNPSDHSLRQIWNYWDGLMNIENITSTGYKVAFYMPFQVTGIDPQTGLYTVEEGAVPFKSFEMEWNSSEFVIIERTPQRQDYVCTWSCSNQAWSLSKGSGADAIVTQRTRTELEPTASGNLAVWQLVTEVSKGGAVASRVCEVYQTAPVGELLLTRVDGYGFDEAQTTAYEYNGAGRLSRQTNPDGSVHAFTYDATGRLERKTEPWGEDAVLVTHYEYAHSDEDNYNADLASITRNISPASGVLVELSKETYTYTYENNIKRVETRTRALGSPHTQITAVEKWLATAENAFARGRTRMEQAANGIQTWYDYAAAMLHGALYSVTKETKVQGELVPGQSTRSVSFVSAEGNTVREELYALLPDNTWEQLEGVSYTFDEQNRWITRTRDNGRSFSRALMCTGDPLWEVDEDGVRTDYAYDSARVLIETTRSETPTTPETIVEYEKDGEGRITRSTTRVGAMETTSARSYDILGRVSSETDVLGRVTTYAYSSDGLTTTRTVPGGATYISRRLPDNRVKEETGSGQRTLYHGYEASSSGVVHTTWLSDGITMLQQEVTNGFGQPVSRIKPTTREGEVLEEISEYNALGQLSRKRTGMEAPTVYTYDSMSHVIRQVLVLDELHPDDPLANRVQEMTTSFALESDGVYQVTVSSRFTEAGDRLTSSRKELLSQLSNTVAAKRISTDARGETNIEEVSYHQTMAGRLTTVSNPASDVASTSLEVDGFIVSQTDFSGLARSFARSYTSSGIVYTDTDPRGNTATMKADIAGRTIEEANADGSFVVAQYGSHGDDPVRVETGSGLVACYKFDIRGRKVAEYGTAIQPVCYSYNDANLLTSMTTYRSRGESELDDPSDRTDGDTTSWLYHEATGLQIQKNYPDGSVERVSYDGQNRLVESTDARGIVTTRAYAPLTGDIVSIEYSDGTPSKEFAYNYLGLLSRVTDESGTRTLTYNQYGENESERVEVGGIGITVEEKFDVLGRSTGYSLLRGEEEVISTQIGYDPRGRISSLNVHGVNGVSSPFGWTYDSSSGLLRELAYANGIVRKHSYETSRDLLSKIDYWRPNSANSAARHEYSYDILGRPTQKKDTWNTPAPGTVHAFSYNDHSELIQDSVTGTGAGAYTFDYDNIGNRKTAMELAEEVEYGANNLNQYTAITRSGNSVFAPVYDAAGNQTLVQTSTGIWTVSYNAENRPVRFSDDTASTVVECGYDYMGRRVMKKVTVENAVTYHAFYIYRGHVQIAELNLLEANKSVVNQYVWDPSEPTATRILLWVRGSEPIYPTHDQTKNVSALFGQARGRRALYEYSPYGNITRTEGDLAGEFKFRWSSEYADDELGMIYYNYRHYNPADGRWIGRDMLGEEASPNLYVYADSNPASMYDSLGLACLQKQNPAIGRPIKTGLGGALIVFLDYGISTEYEACCIKCADNSKGYSLSGKAALSVMFTAEMATYSFFASVSKDFGPFSGTLQARMWGGVRIYGQLSAETSLQFTYTTCPNDSPSAEGNFAIIGSLGVEIGGEAYVRGSIRLKGLWGLVLKKSIKIGVGFALGGRLSAEWTPRISCGLLGCNLTGPISFSIAGTARVLVLMAEVEFSLKQEIAKVDNFTVTLPTFFPLPIPPGI